MPPKKRKSSNRPSHRKGLSGNPQRRALQLGQTTDQPALQGLARLMGGAVEPAPWWADSHEHILTRTRSLPWPSSPGDIEELTCQVVGDEFFDQMNKHEGGFHLTGWLSALVEVTGKAARNAVNTGSPDWPQLWALLRGLALITPGDASDEQADDLRRLLPDLRGPLEIARAEIEKTAAMLTEPETIRGAQPTGEPLLAHDAYGSRFLLAAPFGYPGGDHWYAWDIDMCWNDMVLDAGTFGSPEDALSQWSDAVGPAAAAAVLEPCPEDMIIPGLLDAYLRSGPFADPIDGAEPRPLIREYYRLRRRAQEITAKAVIEIFNPDRMVKEFGTWYQARHGDLPDAIYGAAEIIADHWGAPRCLDDRMFLACSPHRIRQTGVLVRDQYPAEHANRAVRLLPEWTQWCIDSTDLALPAAERALQAASTEAEDLIDDATYRPRDRDEPFRLQE